MARVVFRTDSSAVIGSGHVMRCAALASQLRDIGWDITFLCRALPGDFSDWLRANEFRLAVLPAAIRNSAENSDECWLGVPLQVEIDQVLGAMSAMDRPIDWLVVDHYGIGVEWETALKHASRGILVIDDMAARPHHCDVLLDQNYAADYSARYADLVPDRCRRLLGPSYALLREEFFEPAGLASIRNSTIRRLMIFFGGSDPANLTGMAADALLSLRREMPGIEADIVLGASHRHRNLLVEKYAMHDWMRLHCHVNNMASLMSRADLAIGAGGGSLWERCLLGLPAVVVVTSDNQRESCRALADAGAVYLVGEAAGCSAETISSAVREIVAAPGKLASMSAASRAIMSGWEPHRVRNELVAITASRSNDFH